MVQRIVEPFLSLSDDESLTGFDRNVTPGNVRYTRQRRTVGKPALECLQRLRTPDRIDFDVAAIEVYGVAGDVEFARFAARAVAKPDALHLAADRVETGCRKTIQLNGGASDDSESLSARSARAFASIASLRAR